MLTALSQKFDRIIIGVTNPNLDDLQEHAASQHRHTDSANPFSYESRVNIIKDSIADRPELSAVEIEITPCDLNDSESWSVPEGTVFALRIFSPWEASKLTLFSDLGFKTLELPAPSVKLSASDIRESLEANNSAWKNSVVPGAIATIKSEWQHAAALRVSA